MISNVKFWIVTDFNPHSRTGSDQKHPGKKCSQVYFNPHSRTGSDVTYMGVKRWIVDFNPHSRTGSDGGVWDFVVNTFTFQSTLPHGK